MLALDRPVAKGHAASGFATLDASALPAPRLECDILQEQLALEPDEGDLHLVDFAVRKGYKAHAGILQFVVDRCGVGQPTTQTIQMFTDYEVDLFSLRCSEQSL